MRKIFMSFLWHDDVWSGVTPFIKGGRIWDKCTVWKENRTGDYKVLSGWWYMMGSKIFYQEVCKPTHVEEVSLFSSVNSNQHLFGSRQTVRHWGVTTRQIVSRFLRLAHFKPDNGVSRWSDCERKQLVQFQHQ